VSGATGERVRKAAATLGYVPNPVAHSLRTGIRHAIGLVVPDLTNPFFAEVAQGVEDVANPLGWSVIIGTTGSNSEREAEYLDRLTSTSDGVIISPSSGQALQEWARDGLPLRAVLCEQVDVPGTASVICDNVEGGRLAAQFLAASGAKCPGLIVSSSTLSSIKDRRRGFRAGLKTAGLDLPTRCIVSTSSSIEDGFGPTLRLLESEPGVDAIFATSDLLAIGAMRALASVGRSVPDDVAVCGFDGIVWGEMVSPTLSSVVQDAYLVGSTAAKVLFSMVIEHEGPTSVVLPVHLAERGSARHLTSVGMAI